MSAIKREAKEKPNNWKVKGHMCNEGMRDDVNMCQCVPLTWQRCAIILYRSSETHAEKQEKTWVNRTKERQDDGVGGEERNSVYCNGKISRFNAELWTAWEEEDSRSGHESRGGWWDIGAWLQDQKLIGYLSFGQQDVGYDVWKTAAQH